MNEIKTKQKDSNELLNWLLIIIGLLYVVQAIMQFLAWAGVPIAVPSWLTEAAAINLFGSQGLLTIVLGFFAIVAGIGMFKEEEYAMGMAFVVLAIMAVQGIASLLSGFDAAYWGSWLVLVSAIIGVFGFIWLLFTYKRYD
ncbi:MAG: hypothetical protein MUP85_00055 [Candidatus Lokiarchaeota archaeon]|nr:hypothetical protein [Candidatus Lokiarchaeota archaeon]